MSTSLGPLSGRVRGLDAPEARRGKGIGEGLDPIPGAKSSRIRDTGLAHEAEKEGRRRKGEYLLPLQLRLPFLYMYRSRERPKDRDGKERPKEEREKPREDRSREEKPRDDKPREDKHEGRDRGREDRRERDRDRSGRPKEREERDKPKDGSFKNREGSR